MNDDAVLWISTLKIAKKGDLFRTRELAAVDGFLETAHDDTVRVYQRLLL